MKFMMHVLMDLDKTAAVAQASDAAWSSAKGIKRLDGFVCQSRGYEGQPDNTLLVVNIIEAETNDAISAITYPLALAGGRATVVPVLDLPLAGAAETEKSYRK